MLPEPFRNRVGETESEKERETERQRGREAEEEREAFLKLFGKINEFRGNSRYTVLLFFFSSKSKENPFALTA